MKGDLKFFRDELAKAEKRFDADPSMANLFAVMAFEFGVAHPRILGREWNKTFQENPLRARKP